MTDYLFAMPSIISGVASCIDLFGVYNVYNDSNGNPDKRALMADALAVKTDLENAFDKVVCCG